MTKRKDLRIQIGLMLTMVYNTFSFVPGESPLCSLREIVTKTEAELPAHKASLPLSVCCVLTWQENIYVILLQS